MEGRYSRHAWKVSLGSESGISGDVTEWTVFQFTLGCEERAFILFGVRR